MDLLGNYSSSDDDESSSASERSRSPPTPIVKKSALQLGALPPMPIAQKPAAVKGKAASTTATTTKTTHTSKRGKKLISLHSVLPPDVLEQLTKSEATGDYEDSSDEEEESSNSKIGAPKKAASKSAAAAASKDEGIANFLSALGSARTNVPRINSNSKNKSTGGTGEGKLGAAFVSVTSTTTIRTRKDGTQSTDTATTAGAASVTDPRATPTHQDEASTGSPSHYKPLSLSPRTAFHRVSSSSRVSAAPPVPFTTSTSTITAAPPVPVAGAAARMPPPYDNVPRQVVAPPPPVPGAASFNNNNNNNNNNNSLGTGTNVPPQGSGSSSRSKKRQLQKALRAGNLDQALAATGGGGFTNLEQAKPTAYVPEPETYAVPAHGVRVVATQMYNPKAGGDLQVNVGGVRARGKNQINQLMASAANYELQQARSGQKTGNQRAGAKRKYGW